MLNVCVLGTGYVGLVTGACLAEIGHDVTCIDTDPRKLAILHAGAVPIYEPGLESLVARNVELDRLRFTDDPGEAIAMEQLAVFVAVGTPTADDGSADLSAVFAAVETIADRRAAASQQGFMVVVVKSTVPVGTCRRVHAVLASRLRPTQFAVVSNPEFLREGSAIADFMQPDRIVVGSESPRAQMLMRQLYAPLTEQGHRLVEASLIETSELIKYGSNIFLATKIGLINEFARLCEQVGADVVELSGAIGLDHRIGSRCLAAGPGFGGSCFPKDLRALDNLARSYGTPMRIVEAVIASNNEHKQAMAEKICGVFGGDVRELKVALLGLSFKAGTDDVREAPSLALIGELLQRGARVSAFDPAAVPATARLFPEVDYTGSPEEAAVDADAIIIVTEWPQFRSIRWLDLGQGPVRPVIIDLRNILDADDIASQGLDYFPLGRPGPVGIGREIELASVAV